MWTQWKKQKHIDYLQRLKEEKPDRLFKLYNKMENNK